MGAAAPAPGRAATVVGEPPVNYKPDTPGGDRPDPRGIIFTAQPGEANDLRLDRSGDDFVFRDRGAVLTASGFGCRQAGRHSVRCRATNFGPEDAEQVRVRTHAGNDRVVVASGVGTIAYTSVFTGTGQDRVRLSAFGEVYSGRGNDRVELRGTGEMEADCGSGRDVYIGERGLSRRCERKIFRRSLR
ncbi:MAG TPA: hypothetical protein VFY44_01975 [Thermoleophilaceae bacterium]|nr:hypothetical protein [Thermoleophilaceae bacterium]